jgi:hypothetical protein
MQKVSVIVAALLVPAFVASLANAAPPKKKQPKATAPVTTAPTPTPPPPPVFDTKPKTSALSRVENSVLGYERKGPATPTITPWKPDGTASGEPVSTTSLSSAEVSTAPAPAPAPREADGVPRRAGKDALGQGFSVAPVADFGTSKAYGFGAGARVGYTLASRVYVGGTFVYRVGESNGPLTYAMYYFGPEVGYDVPAGPLVVRPYVGGGYGALRTTYHGAAQLPGGGGMGVGDAFTGASQTPFFWPGVTAFLPLGDALALGADARVVFAPGQDSSTGSLANNGSLRFTSTPAVASTALVAGLTASYRF